LNLFCRNRIVARTSKAVRRHRTACLEGILWVLQTGDGVVIFARQVSVARDLLAAVEAVGRARDVWLDAWRALLGALDG
jgi:hypothetical protein